MKLFLVDCEQALKRVLENAVTSIRCWKAFKSLNLNELPMDMVYTQLRGGAVRKLKKKLTCAVSPAQKSPLVLLHNVRSTVIKI